MFLFEYGPKIFAKIEEAIQPISSRQQPIDPFDADDGANFLLLAKNVSGQRNYDSSRFESVSPISDDDKKTDKILNSLYSLKSLVSKENFKSYNELADNLDRANGRNGAIGKHEVEEEAELPSEDFSSATIKKAGKIADIDIDLDELPF